MLPRDLGFRMPPEWAKHQCTFMEWPLQEALWPGKFEEVLEAYTELVRTISQFEPVKVVVKPEVSGQAREYIGAYAEIMEIPHNDSWIRDNGPTFIANDKGELAAVNWMFNAWGGKYPCEDDNLVAPRILKKLGVPGFDAPFIMEGGSIHVDGEGTLLTTEECLLNKNRNSNLSKREIEEHLKNYLNVEKIIWLKRGIFGDDTDGHVDNVACFLGSGRILIQTSHDKNDPNFEISKENLEILKSETDAKGRSFEIIEIRQPSEFFYEDMRLTLSYINFYFVNNGIVLPVFGGEFSETDKIAESVLKEAFPDRKIATVNGLVLARGGGNVHCLTQQMPEGKPAKI